MLGRLPSAEDAVRRANAEAAREARDRAEAAVVAETCVLSYQLRAKEAETTAVAQRVAELLPAVAGLEGTPSLAHIETSW
jgi:hypothetical protein